MRLFRRRSPPWATSLTGLEEQEIRDAVSRLSSPEDVVDWNTWPDGAIVNRGSLRFELSLHRFAELYRATPAAERSALLDVHFALLRRPRGDEPLPDWDEAKGRLVAKVYNAAALNSHVPRDFFHLAITPDLTAMLQIEIPDAFLGLSRGAAAKWDVSEDGLWETAKQNIHRRVTVSDERHEIEGCEIRVIHGQHRLALSHVLELGAHLDGSNEGVIIGMPHENLLHFHEIRDRTADGALGYLLASTAEMFDETPVTRISPNVYWWRDGDITSLTSFDGRSVRFNPPPAFDALMRRLVGAR